MRIEETDREIVLTFDSVDELASTAEPYPDEYLGMSWRDCFSEDFHGVTSWRDAHTLATDGWTSETEHALSIAENAISKVTRDHTVPTFRPVWDVAGCEVDVARYLSNEPENMIDYQLTETPRSGRVIVLCASVAYSGSISTRTLKRRGQVVTALALAISQLGYSTELWADQSTGKDEIARFRTLVKGANDELDPAKIMFAYAHPAMTRVLGFLAQHSLSDKWRRLTGVGAGYGRVRDPKQDLPDGTIYLPGVRSDRDVPDADVALLGHLRDLGIVDD